VLGFKEPIFKLTFFLLEGDEIPELPYGFRPADRYQHTDGIARSTRSIPADIPKSKIIASSTEKLDPAKQLREAGYPFTHISTELTDLHGKFEVVSKDVLLLKNAISEEAAKLSGKVEDSQRHVLQKVETLFDQKVDTKLDRDEFEKKVDATTRTTLERVEDLFDRKFMAAIGQVVAAGSILYGVVMFLQSQGMSHSTVGAVAIVAGLLMLIAMALLLRRKRRA